MLDLLSCELQGRTAGVAHLQGLQQQRTTHAQIHGKNRQRNDLRREECRSTLLTPQHQLTVNCYVIVIVPQLNKL